VEGMLNFEHADDSEAIVAQWDSQIMAMCLQVNTVIELMQKKGISVEGL